MQWAGFMGKINVKECFKRDQRSDRVAKRKGKGIEDERITLVGSFEVGADKIW